MLVVAFLASALLLQRMSVHASTAAHILSRQSTPAIARLATLHDATLDAQIALSEALEGEQASAQSDPQWLTEFRHQVHGALAKGLDLPTEGAQLLGHFEEAVDRTVALAHDDLPRARALFAGDVVPTGQRFEDWQMKAITKNADTATVAAANLDDIRARIMWLSYGCVGFVVLIFGTGLAGLHRRNARVVSEIDAYARTQEDVARDHQSRADELEQFAGRVAHDIRGPLSTAALATEVLSEQLSGDHARDVVARAQRSLRRAASITDGLLEFARAGARPEPGARTEARVAVEDLAESLGDEAAQAHIQLAFGSVPPVHVACSPGVFASVLGNLVRNAMKYMGDGRVRRISVDATDVGGALRIEVSDTGPGIAPEAVPRLFEPYFRVAGTGQAGFGLGLPTVKKLVEGHGGHVGVRSRVGEGSTFWFELPCASWGAHPAVTPNEKGDTAQPN